MIPPIFPVLFASEEVKALLGSSPLRVFPFGMVEERPVYPYAVWQVSSGLPENYVSGLPDVDNFTTQIDVWGTTPDSVLACAEAMRDAIEPVAHITFWRGQSRDPDTKNYRYTFEVDWYVNR